MQVYHDPEEDKKELQRLETIQKIKEWLRLRWEEIRSIWGG